MARELSYTARMFTAHEAKELGLVSKVCKNVEDLHREVFAVANVIGKASILNLASKSPVAIYATKTIFKHQLKKLTDDNLDLMARLNSAMLMTNDMVDATQATLTKTVAIFPKL